MKLENQLNPDLSLFEKDNNILDPLYYIRGKKIFVYFFNSVQNIFININSKKRSLFYCFDINH